MSYHTVFLVGATGHTGGYIADALLKDPAFHLIVAIRPSSASKSEVETLKSRGAEIRIVDLATATPSELDVALEGVRTVVSAIVYNQLQSQKPLIDAAKRVGVERFVPCDWGTACIRGVRQLHDEKLKIHDYIKETGVGFTFIDVGWWMQLTLPILDPSKALFPSLEEVSKHIYGTGNVKTAVTDNRDIGKFVSRILKDERTLNRYVFCWAEEVSQNEVLALAERISGRKIPITRFSAKDIVEQAQKAEAMQKVHLEYQVSLWIRGDNTIENAKKPEYGLALDAKELYPDLKVNTLESFARDLYGIPLAL